MPKNKRDTLLCHQRGSVNLALPRSFNECTTPQLEMIGRVIRERTERADRYHPFSMQDVKIACFFLLSDIEILSYPDESLPLEQQSYLCRQHASRYRRRKRMASHFRYKSDADEGETFRLYLWQINYFISPRPKTKDTKSAEYLSAGAGVLDWMNETSLTRFPYPTLKRRPIDKWLRPKKLEFQGPAPDMDGFSWQQYRFAADLMSQHIRLSNNLLKMQHRGTFTEQQLSTQAENADIARAMFLATIFNRRIPSADAATQTVRHDFRYHPNQHKDNAPYFRRFPDHQWQPIMLWWSGMMQTLSARYPHVFRVQNPTDHAHHATPLELYTATIATMQKYASLTETQTNDQLYSITLEQLERICKENEELERIRSKK